MQRNLKILVCMLLCVRACMWDEGGVAVDMIIIARNSSVKLEFYQLVNYL